jgi:hypothetical protein
MKKMKLLIKIKWTITSLLIGSLYWLAHLFLDVDLSELIMSYIQRLEKCEFDECLIVLVTICLGSLTDLLFHSKAEKHARETMEQKLRIVHATVATLEDLLGNRLFSLKLLVTHAHQHQQITTKSHEEMTGLIQDSLGCLRQLHNLTVLREKENTPDLLKLDPDKGYNCKTAHKNPE